MSLGLIPILSLILGSLAFESSAAPRAATDAELAPLDDGRAWTVSLLPRQALPVTRFSIDTASGVPIVRVESRASYGNLVHRFAPARPAQGTLSWRWRVERLIAGADLSRRDSDDAAVKVCVLFDMPLDGLPFAERQQIRLARLATGEALPAATLCYVWDARLPAGTLLPNAYTPRMRWLVLRGRESAAHNWQSESRDLARDFSLAFGEEAGRVAPVLALLVGGDADNTGGEGLAFVADLRWSR